jgi:hypothetical protein
MDDSSNVQILKEGNWRPDQIKIIQTPNSLILKRPAIQLLAYMECEGDLVLNVATSQYENGFLGVAMVPITSNGYVVMQKPVAKISKNIGGGIRVPGCTPPNKEIIPHILEEMKEEFNLIIGENSLSVLGLIEVRPPVVKIFHHALVVKIDLPYTNKKVKESWQNAKDKWEGELFFLKLADNIITDTQQFNYQSSIIIQLVEKKIIIP